MKRVLAVTLVGLSFAAGSSSGGDASTSAGGSRPTGSASSATMSTSSATSTMSSATTASTATTSTGAGGAGGGGGASGTGGAGAGLPTAADLLKLVQTCNQVSSGKYATDDGGPA